MKGKLSLITGSTSGIGKATAKLLAAKGCAVILTGRNVNYGDELLTELKQTTSNKNIFFEQVDLADLSQVKDLAYRINKNYPPLDVLLNNAGVITNSLNYTNDGIEMQFGVNHVSHFLLTLLLEPSLAQKNSRVVNVSSAAHLRGKIDFEDLYGEKRYNSIKAYAQSKLANVLFTYELARKYEERGINNISVNALHPGTVNTGIGDKNSSGVLNYTWKFLKPFLSSIEDGAATSVYLASSKQVENETAQYWVKCNSTKSAAISYDENLAERLWNISRVLCAKYLN